MLAQDVRSSAAACRMPSAKIASRSNFESVSQQRAVVRLVDDRQSDRLPVRDLRPTPGEIEIEVARRGFDVIVGQPENAKELEVVLVEHPLLVFVGAAQVVELAVGEHQRARVIELLAQLAEVDHLAQTCFRGAVRNEKVVSTSRYFRQMSCPIVNL